MSHALSEQPTPTASNADGPVAVAPFERHDIPGETILVIEDEDVVRRMLTRLLSLRGYVVLEARSGEEALAISAAHEEPIHLVLSDVVLPGLSGPETVERLPQQAACTKAIYMSGYGYEELVKRRAIPRGAHCIQKPFRGDALATRIREVLDV